MRRTGAGAAIVVLAAGVLAGCGGGANTLSTSARDALHSDIDAVRTAVERDRDPAALAAVRDLRANLRKLADRGDLNSADAKVLLTQIDRIAAKLAARASAKPTTTPRPAPAATPESKAKKAPAKSKVTKGNDKGRKK